MGNKTGPANKSSGGATVRISSKTFGQIKVMLNKLENIYPENHLHFLFLDDDFDPLYANSSWGDLEVGQRVVNSIFAKLRLTAKQFAQTLNESETRCIHMKGDSNIFSYYTIKDFHLVIHRTLPAPPPSAVPNISAPSPMLTIPSTSKSSSTSVPKSGSPAASLSANASNNLSRDRSPATRGHNSQTSTTFVKHSASSSAGYAESSSSSSPRGGRERSGTIASSSGVSSLYRDDEETSRQVEALIYVIEGLIYGQPQK